jgi:hypothetical protein
MNRVLYAPKGYSVVDGKLATKLATVFQLVTGAYILGTGSGTNLDKTNYDVTPKSGVKMFLGETIDANLIVIGATDSQWLSINTGLVQICGDATYLLGANLASITQSNTAKTVCLPITHMVTVTTGKYTN